MVITLDTNAYSALQKGHPVVAGFVRKADTIYITGTVLGELYFGIYAGAKQSENERYLTKFLQLERVEDVQADNLTAKLFGEISSNLKKLGKPMQQNDVWIASLAKQHGFTLISNDKEFKNILGLHVETF